MPTFSVTPYVHKQWDARVNYFNYASKRDFVYPRLANGLGAFRNPIASLSESGWEPAGGIEHSIY